MWQTSFFIAFKIAWKYSVISNSDSEELRVLISSTKKKKKYLSINEKTKKYLSMF